MLENARLLLFLMLVKHPTAHEGCCSTKKMCSFRREYNLFELFRITTHALQFVNTCPKISLWFAIWNYFIRFSDNVSTNFIHPQVEKLVKVFGASCSLLNQGVKENNARNIQIIYEEYNICVSLSLHISTCTKVYML